MAKKEKTLSKKTYMEPVLNDNAVKWLQITEEETFPVLPGKMSLYFSLVRRLPSF